MSKKPRLQQRLRDRVIGEGGEILDEVVDKYLADSHNEFFLFYVGAITLLKDLRLPEIKVLAWMMGHISFNSNLVVITKPVKEMIAADMDLALGSINNALPKLVKAGLIYKNEGAKRDGCYYIHPEYFWKGDISERNKKLKYVLELRYERGKSSQAGN